MSFMEITYQIKKKVSLYKKQTGNQPRKIFFTLLEEELLASLPDGVLGNRWAQIVKERGPKALPVIFGMIPVWNALVFKVE